MSGPYAEDDVVSAVAALERAHKVAPCHHDELFKDFGIVCHVHAVRAALNDLAERGRLLPSGGESREDWAVWVHQPGGVTVVTGAVDDDTAMLGETDEEWARRTAADPPVVGAVLRTEVRRRYVHVGDWSEVPTETAEETERG